MVPIAVELCVGGRELTEPRLSPDGSRIAWVESQQGEARFLVRRLDDDSRAVLAEVPAPRPGRGLGGGCWCWSPAGDAIAYAARDGNVWLAPVDRGAPQQLTDLEPRLAQAPAVAPDGTFVVVVVDQCEVWRVDVATRATQRLDDGSADFVFDPCIDTASRRVAWQAWNVPDMPWDAGRIACVDLASGVRHEIVPNGAAQQPQFLDDGVLACVRDDGGWSNVWIGEEPLVDEQCEHAGPTWGLGQRSFAVSPDQSRVAFTRNERGFGRLCVVDRATREVSELGRGVHGQLSWRGDSLVALRTGARTPTEIVRYDMRSPVRRRTVIDVGPAPAWRDVSLVEPELVEIPVEDGTRIAGRLYRADEPADRLLCWLHGGPTDQWQVTFMPRLAYWRSRGWNILLPDHRGSTGHGRAYQQALRGRWGELDVADTLAAVHHAHAQGWGTPATTALLGSSAGGFTVLGTLAATAPAPVACAVVAYPVTDLADLTDRSHRFERHYTATLVDPVDFAVRSPVTFASRIEIPLLVFHGDADPVVPVAQSRVLVERMRAAGADVELVVYEGEGHGFRLAANQIDEYRRIERFLALHMPARR